MDLSKNSFILKNKQWKAIFSYIVDNVRNWKWMLTIFATPKMVENPFLKNDLRYTSLGCKIWKYRHIHPKNDTYANF